MSNPPESHPRRHLVAFAATPGEPDSAPTPVEAVFLHHPSDQNASAALAASALAALIEVASLDVGMEFGEFLELVASFQPKEWELPKDRGGAPRKNDWEGDYGSSAVALGAKANLRLVLHEHLQPLRRASGLNHSKLSKAAALRAVLIRERARLKKHALPLERIAKDAEKLKQALRGKPAGD